MHAHRDWIAREVLAIEFDVDAGRRDRGDGPHRRDRRRRAQRRDRTRGELRLQRATRRALAAAAEPPAVLVGGPSSKNGIWSSLARTERRVVAHRFAQRREERVVVEGVGVDGGGLHRRVGRERLVLRGVAAPTAPGRPSACSAGAQSSSDDSHDDSAAGAAATDASGAGAGGGHSAAAGARHGRGGAATGDVPTTPRPRTRTGRRRSHRSTGRRCGRSGVGPRVPGGLVVHDVEDRRARPRVRRAADGRRRVRAAARRRAARAAALGGSTLAAQAGEVGLDRGADAVAVAATRSPRARRRRPAAARGAPTGSRISASSRRRSPSAMRRAVASASLTSACALASDSSSSWRASRLRLVHGVVGRALREQQRALQHLGVVAARRQRHLGAARRSARRAPDGSRVLQLLRSGPRW